MQPRERIILFIFVTLLAVLICLSALAYKTSTNRPVGNRAAIVDQLSLSQPNQTFVENAEKLLEDASYEASYFGGEAVTVDFYKTLPSRGFSVIIFRVHSTGECSNENFTSDWVVFFTGETHSTLKYVQWQIDNELVRVRFTEQDSPMYFGITPLFVKNLMQGDFQETAIIMMGCEGLKYDSMAEAFIQKGAKVYLGWGGPVTASQTDTATTRLLEHLFLERMAVAQAMAKTREEAGSDLPFESQIGFYPIFAAQYVIPEPSA